MIGPEVAAIFRKGKNSSPKSVLASYIDASGPIRNAFVMTDEMWAVYNEQSGKGSENTEAEEDEETRRKAARANSAPGPALSLTALHPRVRGERGSLFLDILSELLE